jgi:hypothetical protein
MRELAKKAAKQKGAINKMTPEEVEEWAWQLARDSVAMGEAEYGPDYRKKDEKTMRVDYYIKKDQSTVSHRVVEGRFWTRCGRNVLSTDHQHNTLVRGTRVCKQCQRNYDWCNPNS